MLAGVVIAMENLTHGNSMPATSIIQAMQLMEALLLFPQITAWHWARREVS